MIAPSFSWKVYNRHLRDISLQSGERAQNEKIALLNSVPDFHIGTAKEILIYHDTLLSMLAWPENKELGELAKKALNELINSLKKIIPLDKVLETNLSLSGISGTEITGRFSYSITRWLVNEFGASIKLHSSEAEPETVKLFFRQMISSVEYEIISSKELTLIQRIRKLKGESPLTGIKWLINLFETSLLPYPAKEFLFNELKIFVTWKLDQPVLNRSFIRIPVDKIFYHQKLNKTPDFEKILTSKLPAPKRLTPAEQQHLVHVAKATLVFIHRETDPFTFATPEAMQLFELERGFQVGLYTLKPEQRLSIESYIGYLVFKNGIPVSYGGGWIFGERCQFGINILEPFRGGESAYIFSQLIRLYYQYFGAKRFVVKPYQFGKNNKEALQAGAFWFYYKQGFRPENEHIHKMAAAEWEKKKADKQYRSSVELLKKFTHSNLVLLLSKNPVPHFDASKISLGVTDFINKKFSGNRALAMADAEKKIKKEFPVGKLSGWTVPERKILQQWCLLIRATLSVHNWSHKEKKQFISLLKSKGDTHERNFIRLLQKHRRFWKDLEKQFN